MSEIYYTKATMDCLKRQIVLHQDENRVLIEERVKMMQEIEDLKNELDALKKPKKRCGNCEGGCPQSEVTGYPCNEKET